MSGNNIDENRKVNSLLVIAVLLSGVLMILSSCMPTIAVSTWTEDTDSDFNKGTLDNVEISGSGAIAKLQLKTQSAGSGNWVNKVPSSKPSSRMNHAMATIRYPNTDKAVLFGGNDGSSDDETWVYDLSSNFWAKKSITTKPSSRMYHTMASIYGLDKVVLFGGYGTQAYNDTWVYDLSNNTWTLMLNIGLNERYSHAMASIWGDDKAIIFGGNGHKDETYIYDFSDNAWSKKTTTLKPTGRYDHAMATIWGTDKIVLFGGNTTGGTKGDTWIYDLSDNSWVQKSPVKKPSGKERHAMASVYNDDKVVLFGGNINGGETWTYDLSDNSWTKLSPSSKPSSRTSMAMASINGTDKVVLFGGFSNMTYNGQTWVYSDSSSGSGSSGTYISAPYDTGGNSTFNTLSWDADTTNNTNVKFQLRTAATKGGLGNNNFVGPDGNSSSYYTTSATTIWSGHTGDRWVQYKAYLSSTKITDALALKKVTISFNNLPKTKPLGPGNTSSISDNTPTFTWVYTDPDSEIQAAFQVLISDDFTFTNIVYDSDEQTSGDQNWEFPTGTSYTEIQDGIWYWKVRAQDGDDDWSDYSSGFELFIDSKAPTSVITEPINDKFYGSIDSIVGTAVEISPASGLDRVKITIKRLTDNMYWDDQGSKWTPILTWLTVSGTTEWSYDTTSITWTSSTQYQVHSAAIDNVGNIEQSGLGVTFTYDSGTPTSSIDIPMDNSIFNELNIISGSAIDPGGSGLDYIEISIKQKSDNRYWDGTSWSSKESWLTAAGTSQWSYDAVNVEWKTDTYYQIQARAMDKLANIEYIGKGNTFLFDNKPPENLAISINDGTIYTTSTAVDLTLNAEDSGSGIDQMSFSLDSTIWSDWESFSSKRSYELAINDGAKVVYFKTTDLAGNIADHVFSSIILDSTPPHSLDISIDSGATETDSVNIVLSIAALDDLSGVYSISFSYDSISWSKWEDYITLKPFTLGTGDGNKIIYLRAIDNAGNLAEPVYDTIILNTKIDDDDEPDFNDTDGDGIADEVDAFPNDPAAAMDLDGDGYPENWNPGKTQADSTTGLILDAFPEDSAAAIDADQDSYPDEWNPGKTEGDSTTGLKLDPNPNDPKNQVMNPSKKERTIELTIYFILFLIVIIILITMVFIFTIIRKKRNRLDTSKPYSDDKLLWKIHQEIIQGEPTSSPKLSDDDINNMLEIRHQRGDITEATYQLLKYYKD